jgi:hypothetical protein
LRYATITDKEEAQYCWERFLEVEEWGKNSNSHFAPGEDRWSGIVSLCDAKG